MKKGLLIAVLFITSMTWAKSSDASYEVPGFPPGQAVYDMSLKLEVDGNTVWARYDLPLDLTGVKNRIEVAGSFIGDGIARLTGEKGELICHFVEEKCDARYKDLHVDLGAVKSRLEASGFNPDRVETGLTISRRFQGDPIGIIRFSK